MTMRTIFTYCTLAIASFIGTAIWTIPTSAQSLSDAQIDIIVNDLADSATHSWELGTRAQALLELSTPSFSASTTRAPIPPPANAPSTLSTIFSLASTIVSNRSFSNSLGSPSFPSDYIGPQPLIDGAGAAGDPASLGIAVLIANWTGEGEKTGLDYAGAAKDQLDYLLSTVPRSDDGAISQRVDQVQLWSDFTYMAPPFIAYYGAITSNKSLMIQAYEQLLHYRDHLITPLSLPPSSLSSSSTQAALWKHIVLGSGTDKGHWSTGNGWACSGILRVLGTFSNSVFKDDEEVQGNMRNMSGWVDEILDGMYHYQQPSGLFLNYADQSSGSSPSVFEDSSSTAIIASCAYRHSILNSIHTHIPAAELSRKALSSSATNSVADNFDADDSYEHFTQGGYVVPVVNPEDWSEELDLSAGAPEGEVGSPESEAFVVEMQSAWRDWVQAGSEGI